VCYTNGAQFIAAALRLSSAFPQIEPGQLAFCGYDGINPLGRLKRRKDGWIGRIHPTRISTEGRQYHPTGWLPIRPVVRAYDSAWPTDVAMADLELQTRMVMARQLRSGLTLVRSVAQDNASQFEFFHQNTATSRIHVRIVIASDPHPVHGLRQSFEHPAGMRLEPRRSVGIMKIVPKRNNAARACFANGECNTFQCLSAIVRRDHLPMACKKAPFLEVQVGD
tara:strand:- start:594 stop:1262 length:669 start_codon:yes stop_codon:yes gene_type:complete